MSDNTNSGKKKERPDYIQVIRKLLESGKDLPDITVVGATD